MQCSGGAGGQGCENETSTAFQLPSPGYGACRSDSISKTEAELVTVFAETWHNKTQKLMDHFGFNIWGIFSGNMMRWSRDQSCYRA